MLLSTFNSGQSSMCRLGTMCLMALVIISRGESEAGLLSVLMCLKAKESAETRTFQEIKYP